MCVCVWLSVRVCVCVRGCGLNNSRAKSASSQSVVKNPLLFLSPPFFLSFYFLCNIPPPHLLSPNLSLSIFLQMFHYSPLFNPFPFFYSFHSTPFTLSPFSLTACGPKPKCFSNKAKKAIY